ncbi:MAG: hypothetical protein QXN34_05055 [Archaeoglobaceae archaeon]
MILYIFGHCIESAVKRRYEQLVFELLREENEEKEKELQFLLEFMKKADFAKLRSQGFDGSTEMFVEIKKEGDEFVVKRLS